MTLLQIQAPSIGPPPLPPPRPNQNVPAPPPVVKMPSAQQWQPTITAPASKAPSTVNAPPPVQPTATTVHDIQADRALLNKYVPKQYFEVATLIALTLIGFAIMRGVLVIIFRQKVRRTSAKEEFEAHDKSTFESLSLYSEAIETVRQISPIEADRLRTDISHDPSIKEVCRAGLAGGTARLFAPILPAGGDHGGTNVRAHTRDSERSDTGRLRDGAPSTWVVGVVHLAVWSARWAFGSAHAALRRSGWVS